MTTANVGQLNPKRGLTYRDVENLPADHPLMVEFMRTIEEEQNLYEGFSGYSIYDNEESLEYFDRFIAGDR